MNRYSLTVLVIATLSLSACGIIMEQQQLPNSKITQDQQAFEIDYVALTMLVSQRLNAGGFERNVKRSGFGRTANVVSEQSVMKVHALPSVKPIPYRIGVGDDIELVIFVTSRGLGDQVNEVTESRNGRVSADGEVLFIETGRVSLAGKTLAEARDLIANALTRNGIDPRFQLEVSGFNSQKINMTIVDSREASEVVSVNVESAAEGTGSYPVTERPMTLRELLVTTGLELSRGGVQVVSIDRQGRRYEMPVEHVFAAKSPDYYLTGGDTVRVELFRYRSETAFVLGGGVAPIAFAVSPETRQTLADILFTENGAFATKSARNKEIYLLRGTDPMRAYHLNAQDPSRIRVAAELELRPKDIVFLSTKPIYSVNQLIGLIIPSKVLLEND